MEVKWPIIWTTLPTVRVDIESGEILTKYQAESRNAAGKPNFIKHKTTKDVKLNEQKTKGTIRFTIQYRRQPQQTLGDWI